MEFSNIISDGSPFSAWPWRICNQAGLSQLICSLSGESHEAMLAIYVTRELDLLAIDVIGKGSISQVRVEYKEVLTRASQIGAGAFFLVHNHPSGDPTPSKADIDYTSRLKRLSYELDLPLLDHFVVAGLLMERVGPGLYDPSPPFSKPGEKSDG